MQYEELAAQQTNATAMSNVKWLIVDTCCGLGNLLLMNIRGLMMALRMRRAITFLEENDLTYDMASVLPIIPMTVPAALGWPHTSTKVFATDYRDGHIGATLLMCGDWDALLSFRFLQFQGLSDVHVSMLHPTHGSWMLQHLGDKPFFHLSHFLWRGTSAEEMDFPVYTNSWPSTARYHGKNRTMSQLITAIRADAQGVGDDGAIVVVGVHLRIGSLTAASGVVGAFAHSNINDAALEPGRGGPRTSARAGSDLRDS